MFTEWLAEWFSLSKSYASLNLFYIYLICCHIYVADKSLKELIDKIEKVPYILLIIFWSE